MLSRTIALPFILSVVAGCGGDSPAAAAAVQPGPPDAAPMEFALESSAFENGAMLPAEHRCSGTPSPPLRWSGAPADTKSFAVILRDLDFANGYLHWIIYDIPATTTELPAGVPVGYEPSSPAGAKQATVIAQGYFGPCSIRSVNTYEFTLYALDVDTLSDFTETSVAADVAAGIELHTIEKVALQTESGP
jgi:Raf kinase inhibitor-like YbhB/YbcL family protein